MKVNRLNQTMVSPDYYNHRIQNNNNEQQYYPNYKEERKKIFLGLAGLAVIGAAAVITCAAKDNNTTALKYMQNKATSFVLKLSNKEQIDPVTKLLEGKRDAEALKKYQAYIAQKKIDSLQKKFLDGSFNNRSSEVYNHLISNKHKLQKIINSALN